MVRKLETRFDPVGWQWEENGQAYQLQDLSREDLLQVACACMESLERIDVVKEQLTAQCAAWRSGEIYPSQGEEPSGEAETPLPLLELPLERQVVETNMGRAYQIRGCWFKWHGSLEAGSGSKVAMKNGRRLVTEWKPIYPAEDEHFSGSGMNP